MYFVILAPGLLLAMWAQYKVRSTFSRASEIPAKRGWSGRDVAQAILNSNGLQDVEIEPVTGYQRSL